MKNTPRHPRERDPVPTTSSRCARSPFVPALIVIILLVWVSRVAAFQEDPLPKILHVAFSSRVFPDVDPRDARIAMELWANELSRKAGIPQAQVTLFNSPDEIRKMVRSGVIHLVTLPPMEYLAWQRELNITPAYVAANKSGRVMEYLLIVRRNSGMTKVPDLRGKTLAMPPAAKDQTCSLWLTVLLMREGVRDAHGYLGKLADAGKPSQAILGVFFRQYDAAIVPRGSFETCITVNPQLGKELIILAESKSQIGEITCLPVTLGRRMRQAIDTAALSLHETPVGRQMTTLFHIDRVIPFNPSYLAGLEDLMRERARLMNSRSKKR
jgi:ABC-type phosphate/phosphonate transport system substrate-binding protein